MRPDASEKLAATAPKKGPNKGIIALVVVLVIALIAGGAYLLTNKDDSSSSSSSTAVPKGAEPGGKGMNVDQGKATSGAKTVDIYEDFQCPICKQMESTNGAKWEKLAADGKIKLKYHVLSFLDDNLNNTSSKESANAAFCAADQGKFLQYHNTVFSHQPEKEGAGYTKDQLKAYGKEAGITGSAYDTFSKCIDANTYKGYVSATEKTMGPENVTGTPTVKINGKAISGDETTALVMGQTTPTDLLAKY